MIFYLDEMFPHLAATSEPEETRLARKGDTGVWDDNRETTRVRVTKDQRKGYKKINVTPERAPDGASGKDVPAEQVELD